MSEGHEDLIAQFREITGADNERARFYLEASGWQMQVSVFKINSNKKLCQPNDIYKNI